MRRFAATVVSVMAASAGLGALSADLASAACPEDSAWGTGGVTPPSTYAIGVEVHAGGNHVPVVIYIDDRDIVGTSARGDNEGAGGFWVFMESGAKRGLQRGGENQFLLKAAGQGDPLGFTDPCHEGKPEHRDHIIF